jgi:hypothetical protein
MFSLDHTYGTADVAHFEDTEVIDEARLAELIRGQP